MLPNYIEQRPATEPVDLGPCRCPMEPKPHERDSAVVVDLLGYGDREDIRHAGRTQGVGAFFTELLVRGVISWTLVLPDGSPRPVDRQEIRRLDEGTVKALGEGLDSALRDNPLPNASAAPSPDGRSESGSPARSTRKRSTPTTT